MNKKVFVVGYLLLITSYLLPAQSGTIKELYGDVQLKHVGSAVFIKAESGSSVEEDTIVSTGFKSGAVITMGSTVIQVQPLTRLTLSEIASTGDTEKLNVNLQTGKVRVEVKPPSGVRANTSVQSPSATASVRGTILEVDIYSVSVIEGTVFAKGNNDKTGQNIGAGETINIDNNGNASNSQDEILSKLMPPGPPGSDKLSENKGGTGEGEFDIDLKWPWNN